MANIVFDDVKCYEECYRERVLCEEHLKEAIRRYESLCVSNSIYDTSKNIEIQKELYFYEDVISDFLEDIGFPDHDEDVKEIYGLYDEDTATRKMAELQAEVLSRV